MRPINYDGSEIQTLGTIVASLKSEGGHKQVSFIVVKSTKSYGLIGRNVINKATSNIATFSVDAEHLPTIKGFKAGITLIDNNKALRFFKARNVPVHLTEAIAKELDELEAQGVISPIQHSTHASPVVWAKKANGRYRLCVDFKATLNSNIQSDAYPLPSVEEVFSRIGDSSKFAKIDLKLAYSQIELD